MSGHPNERDPWIISRKDYEDTFFTHGPAWLTDDDLKSGQVGQATREILRDHSLLRLLEEGKINFKEYLELIQD